MNSIIAGRNQNILKVNGENITPSNFEKGIDSAIQHLYKTGDTEQIDNAISAMLAMDKFSKFFMCKILYYYQNWWEETDQENIRGDEFIHYIESIHSISPLTVKRYTTIWKYTEKGMLPAEIQERPIKDQQAIVDVLEQGYEITDIVWGELVDAENNIELLDILRNVKGVEPRKSSYVGYYDMKTGNITWWHQGKSWFGGYLKPPSLADNETERNVLEKQLARAKSGLGLIEK